MHIFTKTKVDNAVRILNYEYLHYCLTLLPNDDLTRQTTLFLHDVDSEDWEPSKYYLVKASPQMLLKSSKILLC